MNNDCIVVSEPLLSSHRKTGALCDDAIHLYVCSFVCLSPLPRSCSHQGVPYVSSFVKISPP